jgi:hypothetical protein
VRGRFPEHRGMSLHVRTVMPASGNADDGPVAPIDGLPVRSLIQSTQVSTKLPRAWPERDSSCPTPGIPIGADES